jgi:hypothetical protein
MAEGGGASIGDVYVDLLPRVTSESSALAKALGELIGRQAGAGIQDAIGKGVSDGIDKGSRQATPKATKAGVDAGGAFADGFKRRVEAALKSLPDVKIDADSSKLDRKIAAIRAELKHLGSADISDDAAQARLAALRTQLGSVVREVQKLREEGKDIPLGLDVFKAQGELAALTKEIAAAKREAAKPVKVPVQVDEPALGRFEQQFRQRVGAAVKSLPDVKITVDSSDADRKIAALRAELAALSSKRVGIDISDAEALGKVEEIRAQLDELGVRSPSIHVKADTAAASAELAKVTAEAERVGALSPTINVDADTGAAAAGLAALGGEASITGGGMEGLIAAGIALGPAIVPAAAAATGAIGALGAVAFAAGSAIGVVALAIVPVIAAVKAMGEAEDQSGSSAASGASRQLQLAGAIEQVRSARAAAANTVANADAAQVRGEEQVANAERNLAAAQQVALAAQRAINDAREQARRSLEDLNNQVTDNALAQRRAALDLEDAQARLNAVRASPAATARQRTDAEITFEQARQQLLELGQRQRDLTDDAAKANKAGVEGSTQVVAAKNAEMAAQQKVAEQTRAVADARTALAEQERQSAFAVAQASQAVINAQRAVQAASVSAGTAGAASVNKLATAMAALSPAGRAFAEFLYSLKPIFTDLSKAAQEGFLPGLQAGMRALLPVLPTFTGFVRTVAGVLGELAQQALTALASPWWQAFFTQMAAIAVPLLQQSGPLFLSLAQAVAALFLAFAPLAPRIIGWLATLAERFAAWATTLSSNAGFQGFIAYITTNGPVLVDLLGKLAVVIIKLVIAFAPLGEILLRGALAVATFLAKLSPGQLIGIAAAIGVIALAIVAFVGGPVTVIVAAGVAIAGAFVWAYTHIETFKQVVDFVFQAWLAWTELLISSAQRWGQVASAVWLGVAGAVVAAYQMIRPLLDAIGYVVTQILVPAFLFFWHQVVEPALQGIQLSISVMVAAAQVAFGLMEIGLKILGASWQALYDVAIRPVWEGLIRPMLQALAGFLTDHVVPAWQAAVGVLGKIFDGIRDKIKEPIRFVVETVLNNGLLGAYNWIASKFGVKPDDVHVTLPAGFAQGGFISGPGGPRDDAILARLSAGEYVIPANVVSAWGIGFFDRLIGRGGVPATVERPGDGSQGIALPAFADGGFVGLLKSTWNALTDPVGWVKDKVRGLLDRVPGAGVLTDVTKNVGHKLIDGALGFVGRLITNLTSADGNYVGPISADVASVQKWIRAQVGKPYIWAGVGPEGFDCSGLVGSVVLALQGQPTTHRIFSTSNESAFFRKSAWSSPLTAGWAGPGEKGGGDVGHTSGNLAGLAFEATPPHVLVGNVRSPVTSFAHIGSYDTGGVLPPGLTIARNDTGRNEFVLRDDQVGALAGRGSRTVGDIHVHGSQGQPVNELASAVMGEVAWQLR